MGVPKGAGNIQLVMAEYQDISSDSDCDVHMYSGHLHDERGPKSVDHDSAISSCSGSPLTPRSCPFQDPVARFGGSSSEASAARPSVIVASSGVERSHVRPRVPLPPPAGVTCEIVTEPKPLMRFRYSSEYKDNRAAHRMVGQESTSDHTTYPTLMIKGWNGPAVVIISLVQDENFHKLHPHSLVRADCDKDSEQEGFVRRPVQCSASGTLLVLNDLCLIRNKKNTMTKLLPRRYERCDPFGVGFNPADMRAINSHAVRLCFEVYMEVEGGFYRLPPLVSRVVRNSGAHQTLRILNIGFCSVKDSMQEIMVLCDKVDKDDISVEVIALHPGSEVVLQTLTPSEVFFQVTIVFRVSTLFMAMNHENTYIRLKRISTQDQSEPYKFSPPRSIPEQAFGAPSSQGGLPQSHTYPGLLGYSATVKSPGAPTDRVGSEWHQRSMGPRQTSESQPTDLQQASVAQGNVIPAPRPYDDFSNTFRNTTVHNDFNREKSHNTIIRPRHSKDFNFGGHGGLFVEAATSSAHQDAPVVDLTEASACSGTERIFGGTTEPVVDTYIEEIPELMSSETYKAIEANVDNLSELLKELCKN